MFAGLFRFGKTKTPLNDLCSSVREEAIVGYAREADPKNELKRAALLSMINMWGAAHLVRSLTCEKAGFWGNSRQFFKNTDVDMLTAEAMVWLECIFWTFWKAEKDQEIRKDAGLFLFAHLQKINTDMISDRIGADFEPRGKELRSFFQQHQPPNDPMGAMCARIIALAAPNSPPGFCPEATPLGMAVAVFYATMPVAFYKMFIELLRGLPDAFPYQGGWADD